MPWRRAMAMGRSGSASAGKSGPNHNVATRIPRFGRRHGDPRRMHMGVKPADGGWSAAGWRKTDLCVPAARDNCFTGRKRTGTGCFFYADPPLKALCESGSTFTDIDRRWQECCPAGQIAPTIPNGTSGRVLAGLPPLPAQTRNCGTATGTRSSDVSSPQKGRTSGNAPVTRTVPC